VVLAGDASGSVDAITGEGMCLAFRQALALAEILKTGKLRRYKRAHGITMKRPQMMAELMLPLDRDGRLRRRALAGLAEQASIFESLLAVHVGALRFRDLWSRDLLKFGHAFLAA
jgi:flavin-dependent dehydrogenase